MSRALSVLAAAFLATAAVTAPRASVTDDPCTSLVDTNWTAPAAVRACLSSFPVNDTLRSNILDNFSRLYAGFHTSTNYQIQGPPPFDGDVHVDLIAEFARMREQAYPSYFDFHLDVGNTLRRTRDGHVGITNLCFDAVYVSYIPFPLVVMAPSNSKTAGIYIAPEAFNVTSKEFPDQIDYWQSLPGLSNLTSFDGAVVMRINDKDPWTIVDEVAEAPGNPQGRSTRQNLFFASYSLASTGWTYNLGNFATTNLPTLDEVKLTVIKKGAINPITVTVPYRARLGTAVKVWKDGPSFFAANCLATSATNGVDNYPTGTVRARTPAPVPGREQYFQPEIAPEDAWRELNVQISDDRLVNVDLPTNSRPTDPTTGSGILQFYQLDKDTGVMALGGFSGTFATLQKGTLEGLMDLKKRGVTKLIIDVTHNSGGFVCLAHWLHRILVGPRDTTEPLAGLVTALRATPLARKIVDRIVNDGYDPSNKLWYNSLGWKFANNTAIPKGYNWLTPGQDTPKEVNGRPEAFGDRIGDTCQPYAITPPEEPLFETDKIVIVSNGRCTSSCALFSVVMSVHYNVKTIVVGGKPGMKQQYCGNVGGQATNYVTMDTQVKSVKLKDDPLAPPDLLTSVSAGIVWRLGYSIAKPEEPEEWQDHPATATYTPTEQTVNRPAAIWAAISEQHLK